MDEIAGSEMVSPLESNPATMPVKMNPDNNERTGNGNAAKVVPLIQPNPNTAINPMTSEPATLFRSNEPEPLLM